MHESRILNIDVTDIPTINSIATELTGHLVFENIEKHAWLWPIAMDAENLEFLALGWPGWKPVRGYHAGSKSGITVIRDNVQKTFVIDWASMQEFPESNVQEVREWSFGWDIADAPHDEG
jgi:hypothetical protein